MTSFYSISDEAMVDDVGSDDVAVLAICGEVDYSVSPRLRERIAGHLKAGRRQLVIDLSDATFIDSTTIGVLVSTVETLRKDGIGGSLAVVCADDNDKVLRIFEITGLDGMIALYRSREEALSALALAG